jgi:hypothetical protein
MKMSSSSATMHLMGLPSFWIFSASTSCATPSYITPKNREERENMDQPKKWKGWEAYQLCHTLLYDIREKRVHQREEGRQPKDSRVGKHIKTHLYERSAACQAPPMRQSSSSLWLPPLYIISVYIPWCARPYMSIRGPLPWCARPRRPCCNRCGPGWCPGR